MKPERIVAGYLVFQAIGTAGWWVMMWVNPSTIAWFHPESWSPESLLSFWLADWTLLVGGSLVTAIAVTRKLQWASIAIWSLAAVAWYPTLYCMAVSFLTEQAWIATGMMVAMAGITLAMATIYGTTTQSPAVIRVTPMAPRAAAAWTLSQTVIFWSVCLGFVPMAILECQRAAGYATFTHAFQSGAASVLFIAASALGLWSGLTMAKIGRGTPLPTATAPNLVVAGPYRYVRNPMAVAGILQGVAVGWFLGSLFVIVYAIAGALLWHLFVRPVEENDLAQRFGEDFREYQSNVSLWVPKIQ